MIVSCPGCSTHYSHREDDALRIGRCSECDETFALSAPKRRYVVMPAVTSGRHDPLFAAGLAETRTQVDRPAGTDGFPTMSDSMQVEDEGSFGSEFNDDEALYGTEETSQEGAEANEADADADAATRRPANPIRELLGVFILTGLGAAVGYHGSLEFGFAPLNAISAGLGLGLIFGWAWIRWAERKR